IQRGGRVLDVLLRPWRRTGSDRSRPHPAVRLDLAPHLIAGDPGNQPRHRATPHAAAGVTARPAPDHPSLAPPAGMVTCLSVRCRALGPTPSPRTVPVMIEDREITKAYG